MTYVRPPRVATAAETLFSRVARRRLEEKLAPNEDQRRVNAAGQKVGSDGEIIRPLASSRV